VIFRVLRNDFEKLSHIQQGANREGGIVVVVKHLHNIHLSKENLS